MPQYPQPVNRRQGWRRRVLDAFSMDIAYIALAKDRQRPDKFAIFLVESLAPLFSSADVRYRSRRTVSRLVTFDGENSAHA